MTAKTAKFTYIVINLIWIKINYTGDARSFNGC